MTNTVKVILDDIIWAEDFIGPQKTWMHIPKYLIGWNDTIILKTYIRGFLQGVYGGYAQHFTVVEEEVSNG